MREITDLVVSSVSRNLYLHYIFTERNSINPNLNLPHLQKALRGGACFYLRGESKLGAVSCRSINHLIRASFNQEGLRFVKAALRGRKNTAIQGLLMTCRETSSSLLSPCFCTIVPASWMVKALGEAM